RIPRFFAALCALALPLPAAAQSYDELSGSVRELVSVPASVVALTNVRVIDGTGAAPHENQTVVITNGRIAAVGPASSTDVPAEARVLDLAGHTVFPGIVGMHNHTFYTTSFGRSVQLNYSSPRLYLGSGVTTIRTTGSMSPYSELNLRKAINDGDTPGPRMHVTGPYLSGEGAGGGMHQVATAEDARRVVAYWAEEGATWFKFYTRITRDAMKAAIDEAHRRGVKPTGHLCSVGYREAVALGIDNLEHGLFANSEYDPNKEPDRCPRSAYQSLRELDIDSDAVHATLEDMVENNVAMTSTLAVYELSIPGRPPLEQRMLDAMSPETREEYLTTRQRYIDNPDAASSPEVLAKAMQYEREFVEKGGLLAAGVDPTGNGGALPGFGDQRNLELLVEAGFTPVEALQIMTLNGAKVLGVDDELGSVEAGKIADLVIVSGNPAATPGDIRNVTHVFKDGVGYDPAKLIESVRGQVGIR
ncbi:MAG TPA: amidohydrolase family protein, partial [Longimicrobiales bacterium]|nr:amidohydrolase family protein [Longimicrobiales bacterium]